MKIDILTLFPEMFKGPFEKSIIKRAQEKGLVEIKIHNLRSWAKDRRGTVDNKPYGGGTGMILMVKPIYEALESLKALKSRGSQKNATAEFRDRVGTKVILLTPVGKLFNQEKARQLSQMNRLVLICGHYEGVDERVSENLVDEEISIGDYVLTGGELPAMIMVDTVTRLIPGVLEKPEAVAQESFSNYTLDAKRSTLLESPQYTRPEDYKGWRVPKILLSGNHQEIEKWRKEKALENTKKKRPDLLK